MRKTRVKIIFALAVCGLITAAALLAGGGKGTLSYLTDATATVNPLRAGEAVIEITETFPPIETPPAPGDSVIKVVRIQNTGNLYCCIRARLLFEDNSFAELVEPFQIGADWSLEEDGYYYYAEPVAPGEETEPLITELKFRTERADGTAISEEDIEKIASGLIVYSEALGFGAENLPDSGNIPALWVKFCS